jgi:hypothetical protein
VATKRTDAKDQHTNINPSSTTDDVWGTMIHHLVHALTNLTDPDIERMLKTNSGWESSQKLKNDCFGFPGR